MWNPFRCKPVEKQFPKPKWPPIQQLDNIDITGKRRDGGVDLVIIASQPVDDSSATLESIRHKVQTYLTVIGLEAFQAEMGRPQPEKVAVIIVCEHPIHPTAQEVIEECRGLAAAQGVRLEVRESIS